MSEVRILSLKSQIPKQNGYQKNPWTEFQFICHNKTNPTKYKMTHTKLIKPSSNIIVPCWNEKGMSNSYYIPYWTE